MASLSSGTSRVIPSSEPDDTIAADSNFLSMVRESNNSSPPVPSTSPRPAIVPDELPPPRSDIVDVTASGALHKRTGSGGRHRRVLSAMEGSEAQSLMLGGNLDDGIVDLGVINQDVDDGVVTPTRINNGDGNATPTTAGNDTDAAVNQEELPSNRIVLPPTISALSQWNRSALVQLNDGVSVGKDFNTSMISNLTSGDENTPHRRPSTGDDHLHTPHNHHDGTNYSVTATAAASTCSQRSIPSEDEASDVDVVGAPDDDVVSVDDDDDEGADLMGEFVVATDPVGRRVGRQRAAAQRLEHERRTHLGAERRRRPPPGPPPPPPVTQESLTAQLSSTRQEIKDATQQNFDRLLTFLQAESLRRTAMDRHLHAQLLMQSESMVAMELKLLRLEARVERRERQRRSGRQRYGAAVPASSTRETMATTTTRLASAEGLPLEILGNVKEVVEPDDDDDEAGKGKHSSHDDDDDDEEDDDDDDDDNTNKGVHGSVAGVRTRYVKRIPSSAASLVSAVTAMSGEGFEMGEDDDDDDDDDDAEDDHDDGIIEGVEEESETLGSSIVERTGGSLRGGRRRSSRFGRVRAVVTGVAVEGDDGSASTPTQSSNRNIPTLDSILLNPLVLSNSQSNFSTADSVANDTTRAVRPDYHQNHAALDGAPAPDDNSTLATSVTSATYTSTVVTGATSSFHQNRIPGVIGEEGDVDESPAAEAATARSSSPLTVLSAGECTSVAGGTGSHSIISEGVRSVATTAAVAPSRDFRSRRALAAAQLAESAVNENTARPTITAPTTAGHSYVQTSLTNRVVSFRKSAGQGTGGGGGGGTTGADVDEDGGGNAPMEGAQVVFGASVLRAGEGDSLTVPEELDNLSDVESAFAGASARWREEYETRLEAIQKRLANATAGV